MRCYVAGPFKGRSPENIVRRFASAQALLLAAGWEEVKNPAESMSANQNGTASPAEKRDVVRLDLMMVLSLRKEDDDAVVVLPGYEINNGARAEVAVAKWLGLRILTLDEALEEAR